MLKVREILPANPGYSVIIPRFALGLGEGYQERPVIGWVILEGDAPFAFAVNDKSPLTLPPLPEAPAGLKFPHGQVVDLDLLWDREALAFESVRAWLEYVEDAYGHEYEDEDSIETEA